ncbi:uncharacterized protein [Elaeis guineensis]|uniref:Uncharacterized protein LOC105049130 n=1 Tax=Elaeis guineensis var. tenera TaxID=51953 RepID=A0A6I9RR16_ELAGV|nr:uncharacterized protein LOC105049130 [Elaeis guineensis]
MGQAIPKFRKGDGKEQTSTKPPDLSAIWEEEYNKFTLEKFDEFYHQFYSIIEKLNEKGGAMQFKLPKKDDLKKAFERYHPGKGTLTKEEFKKIMGEVIQLESFHVGKRAVDVLLFLFGVPVVSLLAKRVIPGAESIPEDILIPVATSGTVVFLTKTHRL